MQQTIPPQGKTDSGAPSRVVLGSDQSRSVRTCIFLRRWGTRFLSGNCLALVFASAHLLAAQAPAPPSPPPPPESKATGQALDDGSLPVPRPLTPGPIVEEPAPAPHEQPAGTTPLVPSTQFREEAAPMPREQTPPPARFWMPDGPRDSSLPDVGSLHRQIETLRMEREAMLSEKTDLVTSQDLRSTKSTGAELRKRVTELIAKAAQQARRENEIPPPSLQRRGNGSVKPERKGNGPPSAIGSPASPRSFPTNTPRQTLLSVHPSPAVKQPEIPKSSLAVGSATVTDEPVDPPALAQSLFRAGDYAAALDTYRKLDKEDQKPEDRIAIQYMMACCLRKLGKVDEASVLYREAANSPGNDFLMENAQWYLRTMKERRELEAQLDEVRQRRQALKSRKP